MSNPWEVWAPFYVTYIPFVLSAISIYAMILAGNKNKRTWLVGLANQVLWLSWIIMSETWGLLPMNIAIWIVYTRNHIKWTNDAKLLKELDKFQDQGRPGFMKLNQLEEERAGLQESRNLL